MNTAVEHISLLHMIYCFGIGFFAAAGISVLVGMFFVTKKFTEVTV